MIQRTVGRAESILVNHAVMINVWGRMLSGALYIGVMKPTEWDSGSFSANICWMDCCFYLDRINSKERIFLMDIINRNINMIKPAGEVVRFYNANIRLTVLVYGSWSIR